MDENRLLNSNSLRPYGRLQSQNTIVTHPRLGEGISSFAEGESFDKEKSW